MLNMNGLGGAGHDYGGYSGGLAQSGMGGTLGSHNHMYAHQSMSEHAGYGGMGSGSMGSMNHGGMFLGGMGMQDSQLRNNAGMMGGIGAGSGAFSLGGSGGSDQGMGHGGMNLAGSGANVLFQQPPQQPQRAASPPEPEETLSEETLKKIANRGHVYEYKGKRLEIRDVWKDNLEDEMKVIRQVISKCNYVAMDTEFPGVVARPIGSFNSSIDFQYQTLRCNVDLLKLIQLGIALADEDGNFAEGCPCWQFHFKFSLTDDMYAQDSIDLLVRSGIDFDLHEKMGIEVQDFGEALMTSGLVLVDDVRWISFHGGYDFGYLLKLLTFTPLPAEEKDFFKLLHTYFPCVYDVKHIMTKLEGSTFKAGLNKLAEELGADRVGPMHQAGSDSLLTASVFFALRKKFFNNNFTDHGHAGILHGLGDGDPNRMNLS